MNETANDLRNEYQIIDLSPFGLPSVEVRGPSFCYEDLRELSGKHGFMTTFNLKLGSDAYMEYGESLTGKIFYALNETVESSSPEKIKISGLYEVLDTEKTKKLKYVGLNIADIDYISFLPLPPLMGQQKFHDTGEKRVPNIINIELGADELKKTDVNLLQQVLLTKKRKSGVELADFEKEDLVGVMLALRGGRIDSRILADLGFTKETMSCNNNIMNRYYESKQRIAVLSEREKTHHADIKACIAIERLAKLFREINKNNPKPEEIAQNKNALIEIAESVLSFRPHILLLGKKQIYWDVDSYIHIVMRHFKKYQLGNSKGKTPFSYKIEDLESLIEQVLKVIKGEYKLHISKTPKSDFTRKGKMAVEFNGDYYAVQITPDGRLVRFHAWEPDSGFTIG